MKRFDLIVSALSWAALIAKSVDIIVSGFDLLSIALQLFLLSIIICFYYLRERAEKLSKEQKTSSIVLDVDGQPAELLAERKTRLVTNILRGILVFSAIGLISTLVFHRSQPSLVISVDDISEYTKVNGLEETRYLKAGTINNKDVYGMGQNIIVSFKNNSKLPLEITRVALVLQSRNVTPPENLYYRKLVIQLPHTRLPIELIEPVRWQEADVEGSVKILGEGRIRLEPIDTKENTHVMKFTVITEANGLWLYSIRVDYDEPRTGTPRTIELKEQFAILNRGF
jgi:hypothetical protein